MNSNASPQEERPAPCVELAPVESLEVMPVSTDQEGLPPELKFLERFAGKTPAQGVLGYFPNITDKGVKCFAGGLSGLGVDFGIEIPDWTKNASRKAFQAAGLDFIPNINGGFDVDLGKLSGLMEKIVKAGFSEQLSPYKALYELMNAEAAKLSPAQAKAFFDGRAESEVIESKCLNLQQRAKICLMISFLWFEVVNLKSTTELFEWLISQNTPDLVVLIPDTDSREIRDICSSIGLHFGNPGGRPPKDKAGQNLIAP